MRELGERQIEIKQEKAQKKEMRIKREAMKRQRKREYGGVKFEERRHEENSSVLVSFKTFSKQTDRQADRKVGRHADRQQKHRQKDSRENKGCVPPPRSAAPQSICCFCIQSSDLFHTHLQQSHSSPSFPPSLSLYLPKLFSLDVQTHYILLIFILNLYQPFLHG